MINVLVTTEYIKLIFLLLREPYSHTTRIQYEIKFLKCMHMEAVAELKENM